MPHPSHRKFRDNFRDKPCYNFLYFLSVDIYGNTAQFAFYNLRAVSPTMAHRPRWENAR
jgi:hypothetical protein